jgi:hypothetical protein
VLRRQQARGQTRAVVDALMSPTHRATRRLRDLTARAALRDRLLLAPLVAEATRAVRALRGAGDEQALAALLAPDVVPPPHATVAEVSAWLQRLIALGGSAGDVPPPPTTSPPPTVLLLLP